MMSYPCIYNEEGKCKLHSTVYEHSWCVEGPCDDQTLSNGDRIRAMTNEDLAEFLIIFNWDRDVSDFVCDMCAKKERHCGKDMDGACPISNMAAALMWLRHEARVDHDTE